MATTAAPVPAPTSGVVPAQLGFLAIYNPSLGTTDDTIEDQIVYYASVNTQTSGKRRRHRSKGARPTDALSKEERHERLRQIGLAQGMVEFGRSFSGGKPVDTIDTERSRVILHELEPGWWILASIDLTRLPIPPPKVSTAPAPATAAQPPPGPTVEYSSREVKPTALLLKDILRAHSVFLLHHASSLSALFVRSQRDKFVSILGRYWDLFLSTWNVLLHGNPVCNVYGGIKIAACGELGIGVGEEERGSGERDVLEGLVHGVEGLVDVLVGRYGDEERKSADETADGDGAPWLGTGEEPGAEDGAVFLGTGALSRHSMRAVTWWMEDMFTWGENAYGVMDRPTSTREKKRRRQKKSVNQIVTKDQAGSTGSQSAKDSGSSGQQGDSSKPSEGDGSGMDKVFSYLKLGYGTAWTLGGSSGQPAAGEDAEKPDGASPKPQRNPNAGRFLIGLTGDVDGLGNEQEDPSWQEQGIDENPRTIVRTLSVELETEGEDLPESEITKDFGSQDNELAEQKTGTDGNITEDPSASFDSQDRNKTKKLRVVVYAAKPFIFVFLFQPRTDSLEFETLYRSLHARLTPIHKSLITSTAYRPERPVMGSAASAEIYDLIWDPQALTVHSTIPNIPEPLLVASVSGAASVWTRVEALNTHNQILNMFMATRESLSEFERTCKTSRGWWIVWNRILGQAGTEKKGSEASDSDSEESEEDGDSGKGLAGSGVVVSKEIFLIRRASDHGGNVRSTSSSYASGGGGWADGASRLAQGIGVDTRRYIEGLLSLNR
ncbi:hypothetical protein QBC34DRAFT_334275 [Podospora aff. communis PSN243]|uniref:CCZ1/INTU/HSP4 first Longin domain-containing protein n=1 Tax=Podospora aff. communis PSN243 TaxID=3040156 RepID=A0AAV9GCF0_9PEZI|nr:hypothetical protein QBC34DRAFT_334275 [Podospora aff. communis PSN243]